MNDVAMEGVYEEISRRGLAEVRRPLFSVAPIPIVTPSDVGYDIGMGIGLTVVHY